MDIDRYNSYIRYISEIVMPNTQPDDAHDLEHHIIVYNHAVNVVKDLKNIEDWEKEAILVAALTHDLDDPKVIKGRTEPYYWIKHTLDHVYVDCFPTVKERFIDCIIMMIELVSCSKWGDKRYEDLYPNNKSLPDWMYIPRYCDRAEAIGEIGMKRTIAYGESLNRNLHEKDTVRVYTESELWEKAATKNRYELYITAQHQSTGYPDSTIDHLYDKCLHIELPYWVENNYLRKLFCERKEYMVKWVIDYWKHNK